ncbi:MAG TPA: peptidylprolyl isomerase [Alphaproteobacteria bacterium]|jgi:peptidylprolyl isomerase|nr:peptidylprolyl isomerase [Alphaproteobacteria bacterium]
MSAAAKSGDTVAVHYTGTLSDGSEFDSSAGGEPISFTIGEGQVISGFEEAVVGMNPGEAKDITIPAEEAYGERRPELVQQVGRDQIPSEIDLQPGVRLQAQTPNGETLVLTVTDVVDDQVTLDANHPLAGEDLSFRLELVKVDES